MTKKETADPEETHNPHVNPTFIEFMGEAFRDSKTRFRQRFVDRYNLPYGTHITFERYAVFKSGWIVGRSKPHTEQLDVGNMYIVQTNYFGASSKTDYHNADLVMVHPDMIIEIGNVHPEVREGGPFRGNYGRVVV